MSTAPLSPTPESVGRNHFGVASWVFWRALAIIHLVAFISFWVQLPGLIGPHGILPARDFLAAAREQLGPSAYAQFPTVAWLLDADRFLHVLCASGVLLSLLAFCGVAPGACFALLWIAYLSLCNVAQSFLSFQWDALLLETTLFAVFLVPWSWRTGWRFIDPSPISRALLVWLLFRLMLMSGAVKITSGDVTWRNLTALTFHYETQPLPTPLAWFAHQLPASLHRASCAGMLVIELLVPFLLFGPRALRHNAAFLLVALQVAVALTGNYAFFNFLTIALCLLAFDDAWWRTVFGLIVPRLRDPQVERHVPHPKLRPLSLAAAGAVFFYTSLLAVAGQSTVLHVPSWFYRVAAVVGPFSSLNNYGLFAVMTTTRPELIFEGSDDDRTWRAYELPYKPGDLAKGLPVVAPHQPRLDWQLWFAALGSPAENRWVLSVCDHLLRGTPEVLRLFARNPFPEKPPLLIRVVRYDYHFTTADERRRTGNIWRRTPLDFYVEPASLR